MRVKRIFQAIFFIFFVISMVADYGCSRIMNEDLSEGKIVYEATAIDDSGTELSSDLLPLQVTLYFKDNKTCIELANINGNINTRLISDSINQSYAALVDAMGQKLGIRLSKDDVDKNYGDHVPLKISFTENTKEIAGIVCKEAICTDSTSNTYSVYYSDEFKIKEPNWTTSFNEIPGILMEYEVQINNHLMKLKAKSIINEKTDPLLFNIPADFKIISSPKNT